MILLLDTSTQYREDHHISAQYIVALFFAKELKAAGAVYSVLL